MKLRTFTELGLDPKKNMLPRGALDLGAPDVRCKLHYKKEYYKEEKFNFVVNLVSACMGNGLIAVSGYPVAVVLIDSGGIAHAAILKAPPSGSDEDWEQFESDSTIEQTPRLIGDIMKVMAPERIAVFEELTHNLITPVRKTEQEKIMELSEWREKEFEV